MMECSVKNCVNQINAFSNVLSIKGAVMYS